MRMSDRLFTSAELAEYLQVPVETLGYWRRQGKAPRAVRLGRHLRYRPADIEKWLAERDDRPGAAA